MTDPAPDPAPEPAPDLARDPAARRFAIIIGVRLGGIVALLTGIAVLSDRLAWPAPAGIALLAAGAVGAFLAPTLLARRWSSRRRP